MTTKKIKWRLANRPTPHEVLDLTTAGILTKEEAREILFSLETDEDRDKQSLQEEIKFLRELVQKLSNNRTTIVETIREVEKPYRRYDWYRPYELYSSANNGQLYSSSSTAALTGAAYAINSTAADQTSNLVVSYSTDPSFTDIKTF